MPGIFDDIVSSVVDAVTPDKPKTTKKKTTKKVTVKRDRSHDVPIPDSRKDEVAAAAKENEAERRRRRQREAARAAMERNDRRGPPSVLDDIGKSVTSATTVRPQVNQPAWPKKQRKHYEWTRKQAEIIARAEGTVTEAELEHFRYKPPASQVKGQNVDPDLKKALADAPEFASWYAKPKAMPKAFWEELTPQQKAVADDRLYDIWWNSRTAEQKQKLLARAEDVGLRNRAVAAQRAGRVKPWMSPEERAKLERALASGAMSDEDEAKVRRLLKESSGSKIRFEFIREITPGRRDILKQMHHEMSPWEMAQTMGGVAADWAGGKFNVGLDDLADAPGQVLRGIAGTPEKLWDVLTSKGPGTKAAQWAWEKGLIGPGQLEHAADLTRWLGTSGYDASVKIAAESQRNRNRYGFTKGMAANFLDGTDWVDPAIEWGAGANIHKALKGEDFSEAGLMFESALFFVPIKGLPSVGSVALRALMLRPLERSIIADSYRASKAVRLLAKLDKTEPAAAAGLRAMLDDAVRKEGKRSDSFEAVVRTIDRTWRADKMGRAVASSTVAKIMGDTAKKVGMPDPLVKWIYNDPRALRMFQSENGQDALWLLPARSRTGKGFEQLMDWARPQLSRQDKRLGIDPDTGREIIQPRRGWSPVKTEQEKWSQAVTRDLRYKEDVWLANVSLLQKALGNNFWHRLKIPEMYAIRMVGKGLDPQLAIAQHRQWAKEALASGDTLGALLNEKHADNFQRAAHMVEVRMDNTIGFVEGDAVRPRVRKVYSAMERAAGGRELILEKLHLLNANEMELRIANEQLLYHGARFTDTAKFVQDAVENNPNRVKLYAILRENGEQVDAEALIAALDAMAINSYSRALERTKLLLARTEAAINKGSTDPTLPVLAKQLRDRLAVGIRPDVFWEKMVDVIDQLPPDLQQAYLDRYGEDMLFQLENHSPRPLPELLVEDVHNALESGGIMDRETAEAVVQPNFSEAELEQVDAAVDAAFPHDYQLPASVIDTFIPRLEERHAGGLQREAAVSVERTVNKVKTKTLLTGRDAALENARRAKGGDLYDPDLGHPTLRPLYRQIKGHGKVQITGRITPENWMRRIIAAFDGDYEEMDKAARWYESFDFTMRHFFGDDAEAVMRGLIASQANSSPKDGLTATLKVIYKMRRGIPIGADEISAARDQIIQAVSDQRITKGFAAKLHDFADSAEGKGTRTWMDDMPDMGWPTANDVHAMRDLGYVDEKLIYRLRNPQEITRGYRQGAKYQRGFSETDIPKHDSGGSPGDHQYWRMMEKYQEITDYLNEVEFMGRADWNPSQVQALGWSGIQRIHGAHPENLLDAVMGNTRLIAMEVTQGPGGLGAHLSADQAEAVAREMAPFFKELVDATDDVHWIPDQEIQFMPGGWAQGQNTSVIFRVAGAPEAIEQLLVRLARSFDQGLVQASRETSSAAASPRSAFVFTSPDFADPTQKQRFFERIQELAVENKWANDFDGYVSYEDVMGTPSIMIRSGRPAATGQDVAKFATRYKVIIRKAARDTGLEVTHVHRNVALLIGDQLGPRDAKTTFAQARRVGTDDLEDPLERRIRTTLADRISVYEDALAQDPEEITQPLAQLVPVPDEPSVFLVDSQSFRGGHIRKPAVYLRFGELPDGASVNHLTGGKEPGVSVYAAWFDQNTGKYVLPGGGEQLLATQDEVGAGRAHAIYQVEGKELTEVGDDGEPLLRVGTPKIISRVDPDHIVTESDPWMTLSGRELDPSETPDWHPKTGPGSGDVDIEGRLLPLNGRLDETVDFVYHQFTEDGPLPGHLPMAPEPGSSPLKPGYVRLYHYTRLGDSERIAKIANEGIRLDAARGAEYGEPNMVWASTERPERGEYVEFAVHVNDPRWDIGKYTPGTTAPYGPNAGRPFTPETWAEWLMERKGNYTFRGDITPDDFLTVQESWMEHARYMSNDVADTEELAERFGWIVEGRIDEDYKLAYRYLEKTLPGRGETLAQLGPDAGARLQYSAPAEILDEWDNGPRIRAKVSDVPRDVKGVLVPVLDEYGQQDVLAMDFGRRVAPRYYLQSPAGYGHVVLSGDEEVFYVLPRYLKEVEGGGRLVGGMMSHPMAEQWDRLVVDVTHSMDPERALMDKSNDELGAFADWSARRGDELREGGEHPDIYNTYSEAAEVAYKVREPLNQLSAEDEASMDWLLGKSGEKIARTLEGYEQAAEELRTMVTPVEFLKRLLAHPTLSDYEKQRVAIHLNDLSGNVLKQSVDQISARSVPGLNQILLKSRMALKGMYNPNDHRLFIGSKGTAPTALHEMVHYMDREKVLPPHFVKMVEDFLEIPRDAKGDAQWTQQNAEDLAHLFEAAVIQWKETASELPPDLRKVMKALREAVLKDVDPHTARYMKNGTRPLPTELVDAVEGLLAYQKLTGKGWHGATDYVGRGKMYLPEVPGFPISISNGMLTMKAYGLRFSSYLRRGSVSHLRQVDKRLEKRFTGKLIQSGRFSHDVVSGTLETQMKAARLNAMFELRQRALRIATERPERPDDIAVVVDLEAWKKDPRSRTVALYGALVGQLDQGKRISEQQLVKMEWAQVEQAKGSLFWGMDKQSEDEAAAFADRLFNELEEPIENVVWVNRKALMDTDIFAVPAGVGKGKVRHAAEWTIDATNDYLKASMLLMNPAYYPMNIVGNGGMMLMSQGALMPLNTMRAAKIHYDLGEYAFLIDHFVGGGLMTPYAMTNALRAGKVSGVLQDVANMIVDRIPRRAEWIYQARKLGYEGSEEQLELLINPKYADDLRIVSERTKQAMVDFDDLSQFEKDVMSRWIFVYPWLKGASVWTARFPKDHPIQAMAYAYLFYYQQQRLGEELGGDNYPDYLSTFIPFSMLPNAVQDWQVPGTDYAPFQGEVERFGEKVPRGVSGRQLFTFTTPYDLLRVATGWITNAKDAQMIVEMANPIYGEIAKQITGYDSFKKKEVDRGPWAAIIRMAPGGEPTILAENIRRALRDETTRARSLYPTTATEDWMRVFLGSIFPVPVNPEVAQKTAGRGALSVEDRTNEWIEESEEALGREIPPDVRNYKLVREEYYGIMARYKKELNKTSLDDNEILAARAEAFGILYPERKADSLRWAEQWKETAKETITQEDLDTWGDYLGWEDLNTWEKYIREAKEAELAAVP